MIQWPKEILGIFRKASDDNPDDITAAKKAAKRKLERRPDWPDLVERLVDEALLDKIHQMRHRSNCEIKRALNPTLSSQADPPTPSTPKATTGPPKVVAGRSRIAGKIAQEVNYLNYFVDGRTLGSILGEELPELADQERMMGQEHYAKAALYERLSAIVPKKKRVSQAISNGRLGQLFRETGLVVDEAA